RRRGERGAPSSTGDDDRGDVEADRRIAHPRPRLTHVSATMPTALTPSMQRLVEELKRLPGIGEKTATRLAFYVLRCDHSFAADLAQALLTVKEQSRFCSQCFGLTEQDPCRICADPRRHPEEVCVVEEPADMLSLVRAQEYRGHYHVLGGTLAPLDGIGPE